MVKSVKWELGGVADRWGEGKVGEIEGVTGGLVGDWLMEVGGGGLTLRSSWVSDVVSWVSGQSLWQGV